MESSFSFSTLCRPFQPRNKLCGSDCNRSATTSPKRRDHKLDAPPKREGSTNGTRYDPTPPRPIQPWWFQELDVMGQSWRSQLLPSTCKQGGGFEKKGAAPGGGAPGPPPPPPPLCTISTLQHRPQRKHQQRRKREGQLNAPDEKSTGSVERMIH